MTTTLHLTSVDMKEFSKEAVQYFLDASYTGESRLIYRDLFREVNKIANVFEMSWLVERCVDQFADIAKAITEPVYEDLSFLFEEAAFVLKNMKSRQLVSIALSKIRSLNGIKYFVKRYLENINLLTCQQLDLLIELTGHSAIHHILKPLIEQLTLLQSCQERKIPVTFKYLIENIDLHSCQEKVCDQLFDELEKFTDADLRWAFKIHRKYSKGFLAAAKSIQSYEDLIIPNLFHILDSSLTFDEVLDWLGNSEMVVNLLMFFEGLWTWMWFNEYSIINCTAPILQKVCEIKRKRNWRGIHKNFLDFEELPLVYNSKRFFEKFKECEDVCTHYESTPEFDCACIELEAVDSVGLKDGIITIDDIFTPDTVLKCYFRHPEVKECSRPGKCGFILKTHGFKEGTGMILCTDATHYTGSDVHYHPEVKARDLHFAATYWNDSGTFVGFPLSWCGRAISKKDKVDWDLLPPRREVDPYDYFMCIVFSNLLV